MKLLFCIKAMNNPGGGAERVLADVANGLLSRQHDVGVLTFEQSGGQSFYPLDARIQRLDLGIGSTVSSATVNETLRRIIALRRQVAAYRPDVAIGFMHSMFVPLGLALVGTSIPMIASEHIVPEHYQTRPKREGLLLKLTPFLVRKITCVSEAVRQSYSPPLQKRMVVMPNPITLNVTRLANPLGQPGQPGQPKILLAVGRLEDQKDHLTLIHAFAKIADDLPDWVLRIVGEGSLRSTLTAAIQSLGLESRIQLPGSNPNIAAEYQAAQLFVIPSRYESLGLTVIEAIAHGLAAVGFQDCPGVNQVIQPSSNGILVSNMPDRISALAISLKALMLDNGKRQRLSKESACILKEYDLQAVLNKWETLLRTCQ